MFPDLSVHRPLARVKHPLLFPVGPRTLRLWEQGNRLTGGLNTVPRSSNGSQQPRWTTCEDRPHRACGGLICGLGNLGPSSTYFLLSRRLSPKHAVSAIVIHVGSNDIRLQQSEKLKEDCITLVDTLLDSGKQCIISGPLPAPCFSDVKFSRICQCYVLLNGYCGLLFYIVVLNPYHLLPTGYKILPLLFKSILLIVNLF